MPKAEFPDTEESMPEGILLKAEHRRRKRHLTQQELAAFGKQRPAPPSVRPFLKIDDLNNKTERDILDCNPEHNAIVFGIKGTF